MEGNEALQEMTVLYVEDEPVLREEIIRYLKRRVGRLLVGENGEEGMTLYRNEKPDIIITDLKMPIMDGLAMAEAIREGDLLTPIIVMTAVSDLEKMQTSIEVGIERYMLKPVKAVDLAAALERAGEKIQQIKKQQGDKKTASQNSEDKRRWEQRIQSEIAKLIKSSSGKGPTKVEAALYANLLEITIHEARTPLEQKIISNTENFRLGDYIRETYYKELAAEINQIVKATVGKNSHWVNHRLDSAKDRDVIKLILD